VREFPPERAGGKQRKGKILKEKESTTAQGSTQGSDGFVGRNVRRRTQVEGQRGTKRRSCRKHLKIRSFGAGRFKTSLGKSPALSSVKKNGIVTTTHAGDGAFPRGREFVVTGRQEFGDIVL